MQPIFKQRRSSKKKKEKKKKRNLTAVRSVVDLQRRGFNLMVKKMVALKNRLLLAPQKLLKVITR